MRGELYRNLTPWQRVQVARHPSRPTTLDYVERLFTDFVELHGDRRFADDHAIVTGTAFYKGEPILVVGHQKGSDTKQKIYRNFGYARPDGYRKAMRTMEMAQKFGRPIICFVDTPAAYPGIESEERGVAEAIALNLREMAMLEVPVIVLVHGEGGSGGALGIAVGDRILMHEFAIYSVIPPEGCAAILWRDASKKVEASEALKITAPDLLRLGDHRRDRQRAGGRRAYQPRAGRGARRHRARSARSPRSARWTCQTRLEPALPEVPQDGLGWNHRELTVKNLRLTVKSQLRVHSCQYLRSGIRDRMTRLQRRMLERELHLSPVTARLLAIRGLTDPDEASRFLNPSLDQLYDPFRLAGLEARGRSAADRHCQSRADCGARRLRRRRHHLDGDSAPRARAARRRRHAISFPNG